MYRETMASPQPCPSPQPEGTCNLLVEYNSDVSFIHVKIFSRFRFRRGGDEIQMAGLTFHEISTFEISVTDFSKALVDLHVKRSANT